jgi:hypothetical protein
MPLGETRADVANNLLVLRGLPAMTMDTPLGGCPCQSALGADIGRTCPLDVLLVTPLPRALCCVAAQDSAVQ